MMFCMDVLHGYSAWMFCMGILHGYFESRARFRRNYNNKDTARKEVLVWIH